MLKLFKDGVPLRHKLHEPTTEGVCNRLHYRATVVILLACTAMVTCLDWIGNEKNISCVMEGKEDDWVIASKVINTYCFVLTTFTLPRHYKAAAGQGVAQPGVGHFNPYEDEVVHKAYYQWVPFVLFLQGMLFYMPHLLFKSWEGGKIRGIMIGK